MNGKLFFIGFIMLGLALLAQPSSAGPPSIVLVGDGTAGASGCSSFDSPYIGFADCNTTQTGGYGTLAVTQGRDHDGKVEWDTDPLGGSFNYTVTSESSEFAGVPGTCGTGNNFDWQPSFNGDSFMVGFERGLGGVTPGSCYYYCKIHGPSLMRGVVIVPAAPNHSADSLTPVNITTEPSIAQSFTAGFSDPDGFQNIIDASLFLSGSTHSETLRYNPQTNQFSLRGQSCIPGQATTLSNAYLTLNCNASSASGSGNSLTVTYNLIPQPPISGAAYRLVLGAADWGGANITKDMGYWVVNRPPHADSIAPMNSITTAGTQQTFVSVYSDPDGYQNIAEANLYLSGGLHNEWLHYIAAANKFFIMGAPGVCTPGQATTLSNGYLTLDCAASSVSGSGDTLIITWRVTPLGPSSGLNYNIFTGVSDQVGAANGLFAGTWGIQ